MPNNIKKIQCANVSDDILQQLTDHLGNVIDIPCACIYHAVSQLHIKENYTGAVCVLVPHSEQS